MGYYVICARTSEGNVFWSNEFDWTGAHSRDYFTEYQALHMRLPLHPEDVRNTKDVRWLLTSGGK